MFSEKVILRKLTIFVQVYQRKNDHVTMTEKMKKVPCLGLSRDNDQKNITPQGPKKRCLSNKFQQSLSLTFRLGN